MVESAVRTYVVEVKDSHRNRTVSVCVTSKVLLELSEIALCAEAYL